MGFGVVVTDTHAAGRC